MLGKEDDEMVGNGMSSPRSSDGGGSESGAGWWDFPWFPPQLVTGTSAGSLGAEDVFLL